MIRFVATVKVAARRCRNKMGIVEYLRGRIDRKLIQEAKEFMISETKKHPNTWHGWMTEEWMVAFAKRKLKEKEVKK